MATSKKVPISKGEFDRLIQDGFDCDAHYYVWTHGRPPITIIQDSPVPVKVDKVPKQGRGSKPGRIQRGPNSKLVKGSRWIAGGKKLRPGTHASSVYHHLEKFFKSEEFLISKEIPPRVPGIKNYDVSNHLSQFYKDKIIKVL